MTDEELSLVNRGRAAETLLENEAFQAITQLMEMRYFAALTSSRVDDVEGRESAFRQFHAHRQYVEELQGWVAHKQAIEDRDLEDGADLFS